MNQIPESVLVHVPFKPKSIIFQNHIQFLDKGVEQNNSEMIFQNRKLKGDNFQNIIFHVHIQLLVIKGLVNGEFKQTPHPLNWAARFAPIRPPPEPPS